MSLFTNVITIKSITLTRCAFQVRVLTSMLGLTTICLTVNGLRKNCNVSRVFQVFEEIPVFFKGIEPTV
jgi:hypothetical protein